MPVDLQIIRTSDFIRAGSHGRLDAQAAKEKLARLASTCRHRGIDRVLLDLRGVQPAPRPVFTPVQLEGLVNIFHEMGFSLEQRLAVLYATDPHHGARLFAFISRARGWQVKAFDNYEEALGWLALTEEGIRDAA